MNCDLIVPTLLYGIDNVLLELLVKQHPTKPQKLPMESATPSGIVGEVQPVNTSITIFDTPAPSGTKHGE